MLQSNRKALFIGRDLAQSEMAMRLVLWVPVGLDVSIEQLDGFADFIDTAVKTDDEKHPTEVFLLGGRVV